VHDVSELSHTTDEPPVVDELNRLVERARQGDEEVLPQLRHLLDTRPEIWRRYGDLGAHAREAWLRLISGTDIALRESITLKVEDLARELAGPEPTAIERLLAERVVLCWLQLHHADSVAVEAFSKSPRIAEFWAKRQASAHRRYLTSLAALATLRRLLPVQDSGTPIDTKNHAASSRDLESSVSWSPDPEHQLRVVGESY
jgi:hypothetical protein